METTMPRKPSPPPENPDDALESAKLRRGVMRKARIVCDHRGWNLHQFLSDLLEAPVGKEYTKALHDMNQENG